MESLFEFLVAAFLVIAGIFGIVGSFGLLKLNDADVAPARPDQGHHPWSGRRAAGFDAARRRV